MFHTDRVVVLVDMDCFYCQVEENLDPKLKGKPLAVVQYNAWGGGGIIAVNYPARERGVTRHMRGDEARQKCSEIELVRVPNVRGKADLSKYRDAGKLVANVLQSFTELVERASVDEAYLDITEAVAKRRNSTHCEIQLSQIKNTYVTESTNVDFLFNLYNSGLCNENNLNLAYGAVIVEEIRSAVFKQTGYTCSAGIAHNKILAKLACGLNKPNKQTILAQDNVQQLFENLPVNKIRSLGGKFGASLSEDLGITTMGELAKFSEKELRKRYNDKSASFLFNIAQGIDLEPVKPRLLSKSIGCCKNFPGPTALLTAESVFHWTHELAEEISERLQKDFEENNRKSKQITVVFSQDVNGKDVSNSRVHPLNSYEVEKIASDTFALIKKYCMKPNGSFCVKYLGIHASKFEECRKVNAITSFFKVGGVKNEKLDRPAEAKPIQNISDVMMVKPENNISDMVIIKPVDITSNTVLEKSDENTSESENSISDTTIDLNENSSDFIFWNEDNENINSSEDSITNEIDDDSLTKKESFFLQYLNKLKQSEIPVKRDFDTSRNLDDSEEEGEDIEDEHAGPSTANVCEEDIEICKECSQKILKCEMDIHKDFHFALKLNHEESQNQKTSTVPIVTKSKNVDTKSKKRKSQDVQKNSLTKFLKNNVSENSNVNTQICSECNKRIPESEFTSHLDYHVAKRIHKEVNPVNSVSLSSNNLHGNIKKGKKNKGSSNTTKGLMAFFKPVS